jgi:hypothetical protein
MFLGNPGRFGALWLGRSWSAIRWVRTETPLLNTALFCETGDRRIKHYEEKGDGVVLMRNQQHSKALMLGIIHALAKQYGWTEFPTDESRFSNPWVTGLICVFIALATYSLFRVVRHRKRSSP